MKNDDAKHKLDKAVGKPCATVVVRREATIRSLPAPSWKVFIDGRWISDLTPRLEAEFDVEPGRHSVKVWSTRGARCSNELEIDPGAGDKVLLQCRATMVRTGLSGLPDQVEIIRESVSTGVATSLRLWKVD